MVPKLLALPGALGCSPESMKHLRRLTAHDPEEVRARGQQEQDEISYSHACVALIDLLDAISNELSCLLEIEDAQWLDEHSMRIVQEIANRVKSRSVLVLLTSRKAVFENENISSVVLRPLQNDSSSTVARALVENSPTVANDFVTWCVASCGGNPYYLIELVRNGEQEGAGYRAPKTLTRLLESRVSLLSSDARGVLEVCCILGKHSTIERIESCIQVSRAALLQSLNELDSSGMLDCDGSRALSRHDLLTSVVETNISGAVRSMLHRYAAAQLEREADSTHSVSLIWEAAEHWLSAADEQRAILLLRRCGNYLVDVGMPDEAARILERAESLAIAPAEKYAVAGERIHSLLRAERPKEAAAVIETAMLLRNSIFPRLSPLDDIGLLSFEARWHNCDRIPEIVGDCLAALASSLASANQRIMAAGWLLTVADNLCDAALAQRVYKDVSDQLGSPTIANESRVWFEMVYHASFGEQVRSRELARELISLATGTCTPMAAVRYVRHAAHVLRCNSTPEDALAVAKEAFQIAMRIHAPKSRAACAGMIASIYMQLGDNSEARECMTQLDLIHDPSACTVFDTNWWSYRAELSIRIDDVVSAETALARCVAGLSRGPSARSSARVLALEAQLLCLKGESISESLLTSFLQHFEVAKRSSQQDYTVESLLCALATLDRREEATRLANEYVSKFRRDLSPLSVPLARKIRAINLK
jgi:tetratricopeptide (TPR) repeat protein